MKKYFLLLLIFLSTQVIAQTSSDKKISTFKQYEIDLKKEKHHKFNENQIRSFVYYWFGLHDKHASIKKSYELLDKKHLLMQYPEITVHNEKEYKIWYDNVEKNIKTNRHIIEKLEVNMLSQHEYQVNVIVNWQAVDKKDQFINVKATQLWLLVDGESESHPYIREYRVLGFEPNKK